MKGQRVFRSRRTVVHALYIYIYDRGVITKSFYEAYNMDNHFEVKNFFNLE